MILTGINLIQETKKVGDKFKNGVLSVWKGSVWNVCGMFSSLANKFTIYLVNISKQLNKYKTYDLDLVINLDLKAFNELQFCFVFNF